MRPGCGCQATISETDPRAEFWKFATGTTTIAIKMPLYTGSVHFPGKRFLSVDVDTLSEDQVDRLVRMLAEKHGATQQDVWDNIEEEGLHILDERVTLFLCRLHASTMKCPHCGTDNSLGDIGKPLFCSFCGTFLAAPYRWFM